MMTKDEIKKFPQCTYYCPDCKYFKDGYCAQPALITDQEREIERFQNEYDKAFERLKAQQREIDALRAENEELTKVVSSKVYDLIDNTKEIADAREAWEQQAKIDVLNELREKYSMSGSVGSGWATIVLVDNIDEMIKELIKNAEDKS